MKHTNNKRSSHILFNHNEASIDQKYSLKGIQRYLYCHGFILFLPAVAVKTQVLSSTALKIGRGINNYAYAHKASGVATESEEVGHVIASRD